jgi:arylsulfatase A-like enzyme
LAEDLQVAGYWTVGVVSNELLFRPYGFDQGFNEWIEVGLSREVRRELLGSLPPLLERRRADADARSAGNVNQRAIRALRDRPHDQFFLYLHYMDVHDHALLPDPYRDMVVGLDRELDGLFAELDAEGLLEGTYVLFTSDHGEALGEEHALTATEGHYGNPSFEPVLRVPLIVAPPAFENTSDLIRSQDISKLIKRLAGITQERATTPLPRDARPGELFLSELRYQTYREGRWKSTWPRAGGVPYLFDLEEDPQESINQAVVQAEVVQRHRERIDALERQLATLRGQDADLSGEDRERLRALGYLE